MDSKEQRSALRVAVYRGDGPAVVDLLRGVGVDDDSLQPAGDGLIAAVMQRVDGAAELLANSCPASGSEAGTGMRSWPTSLRLSSAADRQRCCAPCPSTSRSWPASSKATPSASGAASISGPVRCGLGQRSNTPWRPERKTRTPLMILSGGWRST